MDFALKVINWDPDTLIRLQLWDIAGKVVVMTGTKELNYLVFPLLITFFF